MSRLAAIVSPLLILSLAGCFSVKNTEGLRMAYEDVDLAQSKVSELKALPNVTEAQRREAADLYRTAKSKVNSYLQDAITRAASYTVNEPAAAYTHTRASESVNVFVKKVNDLRGKQVEALTGGFGAIAVIAIEEILKLNAQAQREAYDRFVETVNKYKMMNYEDIPAGQLGNKSHSH